MARIKQKRRYEIILLGAAVLAALVVLKLAWRQYNVRTARPAKAVLTDATYAKSVRQDFDPNVYEGDSPTIRVSEDAPTPSGSLVTRHAYLKFIVSGLHGPAQSAKIRLYTATGSSDGGQIYVVSNDWSEKTLLWENAPPISGLPVAALAAVEASTWVEFDVTKAITGDGIYSFAITNNTPDMASYVSNYSTHPEQQPKMAVY